MLLVLFDTAVKGSIVAVLKGQIKQKNKKRTNMEEKALENKKQRAE